MAQPQAYNRETDFTERDGDDTNHAGINTELDAAALSINELRDNLALIQRDDGALKNGIVTAESLSDSAFNAVLGEVATATAAASASADRSTLFATQAEADRIAAQAAATAAQSSQTAAATSATAAANSQTAAENSATSASTSASTATTKASEASTSATNAANSATASAGSATTASTQATNAANSATAAATSATNSANSATTATTQAGIATTQASNAAASATAASASFDEFDDRYLGSKTVDPTTDNDGNALLTGALYFNSVAGEMRVWAGTFWKATGSSVGGTINTAKYTATAGQTTFAIVYDVGFVHVYLNGVKLESGVEFTANNGTSVVLATGATAGDVVDMIAFGIFSVANTYTKAELNASTGSSNVGFTQSGTGAVKRTVQDKEREIISVKDFGAVGDNTHRPLSGVTSYNDTNTTGWTVAQWQTVFPHVTSLTNTLDWAGIQAAINFASTPYKRAAVFVPAGYYVITDPIQLPNFLTIYGDADGGTIINNQNVIYTGSQAVNQDPAAFLFVTMKHIIWRGGRTGLDVDVTGECAGCRFENVIWELQTDFNVNINKLLQTTSFINCNFDGADYGLFVGAWTSNANNFINCSFTSHAWSHVYMRSSEVNNFYGCRFEAGGIQGRTTIDVTDTRNMNFLGCYFEATHENLIAETGSCNSILFDGCHFTGATRQGQSGWFPYQFVSDGIIQFGNNNWGVINSNGPTRMFASGVNSSVLPGNAGGTIKQLGNTGTQTVYFAHSKQHKHIVSPWVAPTSASWQKDLVVFKKENTDGAVQNMRMLTGKLTVSYYGLTGGGFEQRNVREYLVFVRTAGFGSMGAVITLGTNDSAGGQTLTVQQKAGANNVTLVVEAVFSGLDYGIGGMLQWSFEYIHGSKTEMDYIEASLA